jgi:bla regulator protein blaR1
MMPATADVIAPLERLFQILLTASIAGTVVILAIAALCRFTSRLTPALRCTLWWLAALKLLVALVWVEPVVLRVLPAEDAVWRRGFSPAGQAPPIGGAIALTGGAKAPPPQLDDNSSANLSWRALVAATWIAGAIAGLCVMFLRIRKTARIVAQAQAVEPHVQLTVRELCARAGVRRGVEARWSSDIDAPMIVGLLRPMILLPADRFHALSTAEQRMAICHEIVHLRRGDLWLGCVPALAERLFFFHPLAILAAREYLLAREAACDRAVLRLLDAAPQEYGRLLLSLGVSPMRTGLAAAGASRSFSNLKRRIAMLGHRSPSSLARLGGWLAAGAAVCALLPIQLGTRASAASPALLPPHLKALPWAAKTAPDGSPTPAPVVATAAVQEKSSAHANKDDRLEFILVNRDRHGVTMSGSSQNVERLKRKYGENRVLWFRYSGKDYVVQDAAALDEAEQINRPVAIIGAKQGEVGAKQGAVGAKQGAVGAKQGAIGAKQGAIGAKQGHIGAQQAALAARELGKLSDAERREIEAEHERLGKEMASLNEEMAKLGEEMQRASEPMDDYSGEMRELSKEMDVLSRQMNEAVAKANREMIALAERLIKNGLAQLEP